MESIRELDRRVPHPPPGLLFPAAASIAADHALDIARSIASQRLARQRDTAQSMLSALTADAADAAAAQQSQHGECLASLLTRHTRALEALAVGIEQTNQLTFDNVRGLVSRLDASCVSIESEFQQAQRKAIEEYEAAMAELARRHALMEEEEEAKLCQHSKLTVCASIGRQLLRSDYPEAAAAAVEVGLLSQA